MKTQEIIQSVWLLKNFACDDRCNLLDIEMPWIADGWMIATDGRAIAMVPCDAENSTPVSPFRYPDFRATVLNSFEKAQFTPWPGIAKFKQRESTTETDCESCGAQSLIVNVIISEKCFDQRFINQALLFSPESFAIDGDLLMIKGKHGRVAIMARRAD